MNDVVKYPVAVLVLALAGQYAAAYYGVYLRKRTNPTPDAAEFSITLPAALTLLALMIGFSFSLAVGRYDQRKNYEEAEANAIGTEYVRADLLPAAAAVQVRELLVRYTQQRILFYQVRNRQRLAQIGVQTTALQNSMWHAVVGPALVSRDQITGLAVEGMNDVINSQGFTQAAWWYRIPSGAWLLMGSVAIICNLLVGYSERRSKPLTLLILPSILAAAFFMLSDIDSPRAALIHVTPQNLMETYQTITIKQ